MPFDVVSDVWDDPEPQPSRWRRWFWLAAAILFGLNPVVALLFVYLEVAPYYALLLWLAGMVFTVLAKR